MTQMKHLSAAAARSRAGVAVWAESVAEAWEEPTEPRSMLNEIEPME